MLTFRTRPFSCPKLRTASHASACIDRPLQGPCLVDQSPATIMGSSTHGLISCFNQSQRSTLPLSLLSFPAALLGNTIRFLTVTPHHLEMEPETQSRVISPHTKGVAAGVQMGLLTLGTSTKGVQCSRQIGFRKRMTTGL